MAWRKVTAAEWWWDNGEEYRLVKLVKNWILHTRTSPEDERDCGTNAAAARRVAEAYIKNEG